MYRTSFFWRRNLSIRLTEKCGCLTTSFFFKWNSASGAILQMVREPTRTLVRRERARVEKRRMPCSKNAGRWRQVPPCDEERILFVPFLRFSQANHAWERRGRYCTILFLRANTRDRVIFRNKVIFRRSRKNGIFRVKEKY